MRKYKLKNEKKQLRKNKKYQNDIKKKEYRQYRIGITREDSHNSQEGRNSLFKGYDSCISGTDVERRTGATVYLPNLRDWMLELRQMVISKLEEKNQITCSILKPKI